MSKRRRESRSVRRLAQAPTTDSAPSSREAIRLSPTIESAYKNLGILLQTNGGSPEEIIPVWERYLELRPDDPEGDEIRAAIERLRGQVSPTP